MYNIKQVSDYYHVFFQVTDKSGMICFQSSSKDKCENYVASKTTSVGDIIKAKIIEGENKITDEVKSAIINGKTVIVDYNFEGQKCGFNKSNVKEQDELERLIKDIIDNDYKYIIL